jgi:Predicted pPIWI-associating nuclease
MSEGAGRFFNSIEDAALLSEAGLTDFFVYYLTIEAEVGAANATNIAECFKACDLTPPVRTAPYLSEGLKSKPQKFVKVDGGYKLQRHYRETLSKRLRVELAAVSSRASSSVSNGLTPDESKLLETIDQMVPSANISYRQALIDLQDDKRVSFRGPALELREVLREVLDHVAPDKDVLASPGFQLEKNRPGPTMKQKVRYILRARGVGKTKAASPEDSTSAVDAIVSDLTRSVYDLGSLATHVASERRQVVKVKRYIDAVLHDILEIG